MDVIIVQLIATLVVLIPCLGISFVYFMVGKQKPFPIRVLKSSHGILIIVAFFFSLYSGRFTVAGNIEPWMTIFCLILSLAGISAILSLFNYINFRWHLLYIIEGLIGFMVWGWGIMALTHDSM